MARRNRDRCFDDLTEWLQSHDLDEFTGSPDAVAFLKRLYKRYHALLVLHQMAIRTAPRLPAGLADVFDHKQFRDYFSEGVSDVGQSVLLWFQGELKPAMLSLRSSIENTYRWVLLQEGIDATSIGSVYELIDTGAASRLYNSSPFAKSAMDSLHSEYVELCKFAHSASTHLELKESLADRTNVSDPRYKACFDRIYVVMLLQVTVIVLAMPKDYLALHHDDLDDVADVLRADVKKMVTGA